jgi:hypothetical protein
MRCAVTRISHHESARAPPATSRRVRCACNLAPSPCADQRPLVLRPTDRRADQAGRAASERGRESCHGRLRSLGRCYCLQQPMHMRPIGAITSDDSLQTVARLYAELDAVSRTVATQWLRGGCARQHARYACPRHSFTWLLISSSRCDGTPKCVAANWLLRPYRRTAPWLRCRTRSASGAISRRRHIGR